MPSIRLCRGFSEIPPSPPTMSDFLSEGKLLDAFRSVVSRKFRDVGPTLEDTCAHYAFLFSRCSPPRSRAVDTARCVRIPCSGHIGSWSSPPARKCRRESQDCSPKSSQSDSHRKAPSWWWMRSVRMQRSAGFWLDAQPYLRPPRLAHVFRHSVSARHWTSSSPIRAELSCGKLALQSVRIFSRRVA